MRGSVHYCAILTWRSNLSARARRRERIFPIQLLNSARCSALEQLRLDLPEPLTTCHRRRNLSSRSSSNCMLNLGDGRGRPTTTEELMSGCEKALCDLHQGSVRNLRCDPFEVIEREPSRARTTALPPTRLQVLLSCLGGDAMDYQAAPPSLPSYTTGPSPSDSNNSQSPSSTKTARVSSTNGSASGKEAPVFLDGMPKIQRTTDKSCVVCRERRVR